MVQIEVVAALIIRGGRFFAAQRGEGKSHPGAWEFPGGKIEPGETPQEALMRELAEELDMTAYPVAFVTTKETHDPDRIIRVHLYRVLLETEHFSLHEHQAADWFTPEQAQALPWTEADRAFLPSVIDAIRRTPSVYAALPEDFDALPTHTSGAHIFKGVQRAWTYKDGQFAFGHKARMLVETAFDTTPIHIADAREADDGTTRIIYALRDGARVETIHMPRDVKSPRVTLCLSSQVGCAMRCAFCATATLGLKRNLTAGEIVQEVLLALQVYGPHKTHAVNLVFMGMGEALMNYDNVMRAIAVLSHIEGLNIAPVRMTLSTSGVLDKLLKLRDEKIRPNIAVSINATTDDVRKKLMPVTERFGLMAIREALLAWPYRSHEKILLEYVLLRGINDSPEDAHRLAAFARGMPHNINIIPYNPTPHVAFDAPAPEQIQAFIKMMQDEGCFVTLREARGVRVGGACGQLIARLEQPSAMEDTERTLIRCAVPATEP